MRLVVLGRQGSGKGTQCARLSAELSIAHVSTGDLLRAAVERRTALGRRVERFLQLGELVPEDLALAVLSDRLAQDDVSDRGFVLDGFPRTVSQARQLATLLGPAYLDAVFELSVPEDVVVQRMLRRRVCTCCGNVGSVTGGRSVAAACNRCGEALTVRPDDFEPIIRRRLELYEAETAPLMHWFAAAGLLTRIDGLGPPDVVAGRLEAALRSPGPGVARGADLDTNTERNAPAFPGHEGLVASALSPVIPPVWVTR